MREIWRQDSSSRSSSDVVELRKYFTDSSPLPNAKSSLATDSSIYWGQSDSQSFTIRKPVATPFWSFIFSLGMVSTQAELEDLVLYYSGQALLNLSEFTRQAGERYQAFDKSFIQVLPRDFRELACFVDDPLVSNAFTKVDILRRDLEQDLECIGSYSLQETQIAHGCFRFRNIWFNDEGRLLIVAGDDLVWGSSFISIAALLADLFDLYTSKMDAAKRPLKTIYIQTAQSLSDHQKELFHKAIYLYILAHHAQYIHTLQYKDPLKSLAIAAHIPDEGLLSVIES